MDFDRVLGLDLMRPAVSSPIPADVSLLAQERETLRSRGAFPEADLVRQRVRAMGYELRDTKAGTRIVPVPKWLASPRAISSSGEVPSRLDEPDEVEFTIGVVARRGAHELSRCVQAARRYATESDCEIIVVDNGLEAEEGQSWDDISRDDSRVRTFHADHFLGAAAGRNIVLKQARGRFVLLLDTSVELTGNVLPPIRSLLEDPRMGLVGRWGATSADLRDFEEAPSSGDVDAVEGYVLAFRRDVLREIGLLDEKYRFYRHLDLDFSLAVRSRGYRAVIDTELPVARHEHVEWSHTPPDERERLSKRNFYRFLRKWGKRNDLLVASAR
jgi:GT2 family glycosyltransferase